MRFISIYRPDTELCGASPRTPSPQQIEEMGKFINEALAAGVLVATEGFGPSQPADVKIRLSQGTYTTTDGPFSEAKEVIGGFAIMQVKSREEVVEWTRRFLAIAGDGEAEVRQLFEMSPIDQIKQRR
jgi:hypothetical protein